MIWYKRFPGDYLSKTQHLSLAGHGAYCLMLETYYATERPLPRDRAARYRLLRAFDPDEREAVDSVLAEFWIEGPDGWVNQKATEVMAEARDRSDTARKSANHRWRKDANADANAVRPHMRTQSEGTCESVCESDANQKSEARLQNQNKRDRNLPPAVAGSSSERDDPAATGWHLRGEAFDRVTLETLTECGSPLSVDTLAAQMGAATGTVRKSLNRMVRRGDVIRDGAGGKGSPALYRPAPHVNFDAKLRRRPCHPTASPRTSG